MAIRSPLNLHDSTGIASHFGTYRDGVLGRTPLEPDELDECLRIWSRHEEYAEVSTQHRKDWPTRVPPISHDYRSARVEKLLGVTGNKITWPNNKRFALCLTHDVDHLSVAPFLERVRALRWGLGTWSQRARLSLSAMGHGLRHVAGRVRPCRLDAWLRVEERHGFRSTFFFMAGPPPQPNACDGLYLLEDEILFQGVRRPLREVLPELARGGWEIGMHGSIATAFDAGLARQERLRLSEASGTEVIAGRQHYLNYDIRCTPLIHEQAGLLVDSTLGANDVPVCYRAGMGLPYPMYDLIHDRSLNVVQVPLIIQDNPLLAAANHSVARATHIVVEEMQRVADRGSMLTVLFHTNHLEDSTVFRAYSEILGAASEMHAWGCTVSDAYQWLKTRTGRSAAE